MGGRGQRVVVAALVALAAAAVAADEPAPARFTYLKVFPGSLPEYTALSLQEDGRASYDGRALAESPHPEDFTLPAELVRRVFALLEELNHLESVRLESPRKIANLGQKTFRYEKGAQRAEVQYNYTTNPAAIALQELCEKIARGRFYIAQIQFRLKYDRLGLLGALRDFEYHFNNHGFVYPEQFVPVLTQVAEDPRVVRLAQMRAQRLLERIRGASRVHFEQADESRGWYVAVTLPESGPGRYELRRLDAPSQPQSFEVSAALRGRVFELLRQASYLQELAGQPEFAAGRIRLAYEQGDVYNRVAFNRAPTAELAALAELFGKIVNQLEFRARLAQALGQQEFELPGVLFELEQAVSQRALAEPEEFMPALERVVSEPRFATGEQALAQKILDKIRRTP